LPDLVVLDLMMDGIDGYSVCETLRRQPSTRAMPIIILTAAGGEIARRNALASGADGFMTKPLTPRGLARFVEIVLRSHQRNLKEADADCRGSGRPTR
jgi:DNA-binding response OmpR family regulator